MTEPLPTPAPGAAPTERACLSTPTHLAAPLQGEMRLRLIGEQEGALHVDGEGDLCPTELLPGNDPLVQLLGPEVFSRKVLLGLEKATFLDTRGVSWLVSWHANFQEAGGVLVLHSLPPRVRYVLRLLRLDQVLHTAADLAAAHARAQEGVHESHD